MRFSFSILPARLFAAKGSRVTIAPSRTQCCQLPTNEYVSRHRRSIRAGVSWPNDDEHHAGGEDSQAGLLVGRAMTRSIIGCVLSSARLRDRPRARRLRRK